MSYVDRRVFVNDSLVVAYYFLMTFFALMGIAILILVAVAYASYRLLRFLVVRFGRARQGTKTRTSTDIVDNQRPRGPRDWVPDDSK